MLYADLLHPWILAQKANTRIVNAVDVRLGNVVRRASGSFKKRHKTVRAFWWTTARNFGDLITPALLKHAGFTPILSTGENAHLVATGSVLGMIPKRYSGHIFGSGLLSHNPNLRFSSAKIHAVRGVFTRECIRAPEDVVLGDPGLLVTDLLPSRSVKRFVLGVVPHYEDRYDPRILSLFKRNSHDVRIINVQRVPRKVMKDIDECRYVLSSSLHGIVVADTLGIPNAWTILSDHVFGKGFKFHDYYSAFDIDRQPIVLKENDHLERIIELTETPPAELPRVRDTLRDTWHRLCDELSMLFGVNSRQ